MIGMWQIRFNQTAITAISISSARGKASALAVTYWVFTGARDGHQVISHDGMYLTQLLQFLRKIPALHTNMKDVTNPCTILLCFKKSMLDVIFKSDSHKKLLHLIQYSVSENHNINEIKNNFFLNIILKEKKLSNYVYASRRNTYIIRV